MVAKGLPWRAWGTPAPAIERLNREFATILRSPEMRESARADGSIIHGGTPEQFSSYLKSEVAKYGKLVREAGIKIEGGI